MSRSSAVVGVSEHNGWAIFVCVSARAGRPVVIDRRRVQLLDSGLPRQPYHHEATELELDKAEALITRVEESAAANALSRLTELQQDIESDHELVAISIREDPVRPLPKTVAEILSHHPSMHAAEGILYRRALRDAGHTIGIEVDSYPRKNGMAHFVGKLETVEESLDDLLKKIGKSLGPPWQKDHKVATSAAMAVLCGHCKLNLAI
ncbi:MAG: hypothetical protein O6945_11380 [Gammaproteobacteria bacterium]|nr:hypothetical protein [Gammaproteobacteria bacterium]